MKEILIAFDVDGTLISNKGIDPNTPTHMRPKLGLNLNAITLLQILSEMKNTRIMVWSGGGKQYAESIGRMYGLDPYVDDYAGKDCLIKPDICFDDVHACELADKNIIVKFK